jgi:hypothetical protein
MVGHKEGNWLCEKASKKQMVCTWEIMCALSHGLVDV